VIAVSQTTLRDLIARLSVPADRIRVVHHGVDPIYRPLPPAAVAEARARYQLPAEFVFTVGTIQPRKNLGTLARAMRTVAANGLPHHLVIAGKRGWFADRVEREVAASGMAGRVRWLGYVPAADLPALYNAADAFCLPSRSEGFGLPVLEAMACGVPCLLADRAALPEVAGDAALLADPSDRDAFGAALVHLLGNPELRLRLSGAGKERTGEFTWDRCASQTLTVLREALDQGKPS
jgi:glycosyltransferase involved in cell wall biosynthesis